MEQKALPRGKSDTLLTDAVGDERKQAGSRNLGNLGVLVEEWRVAGNVVTGWSNRPHRSRPEESQAQGAQEQHGYFTQG